MFNVKIPFKVAQNPIKRIVKVKLSVALRERKSLIRPRSQVSATSENLNLRFDPPMLDLNPILPFVEESEKLVTVYNETDTEIEVSRNVSGLWSLSTKYTF